MPAGLWRGYIEALANDELPFDDRRFLAFSVAPPARVLIVDGDPGRAPTSRRPTSSRPPCDWRRRANTMEKHRSIRGRSSSPVRPGFLIWRQPKPSCWRTSRSSAPDVKRLGDFVDRGGGLLVFTGDRVRPEWARVLEGAGLGVGEVLETANATELPWRLEHWDARHPIFKPFADPEHGDLRRPAFTAITPVKPDKDARVLASFRGGARAS